MTHPNDPVLIHVTPSTEDEDLPVSIPDAFVPKADVLPASLPPVSIAKDTDPVEKGDLRSLGDIMEEPSEVWFIRTLVDRDPRSHFVLTTPFFTKHAAETERDRRRARHVADFGEEFVAKSRVEEVIGPFVFNPGAPATEGT